MNREHDNQVKQCRRADCRRATFVETDEGLSANFHHGSTNHQNLYTIEQMANFLAARGYVVVEAAKILRVA